MKHEENGYHDPYHGIDLIMDAEKYVDTGITLSTMRQEIPCEDHIDEQVTMWSHIAANMSKEFYHVYQEWKWSTATNPREISSKRNFSFLGFYRKYSESDIFEIMRLKKQVREQTAVKLFETQMLYCDFQGNSALAVLYKDIPVLSYLVQWVKDDHATQEDGNGNELENENLRRLYYQLTCHEIGKKKKKKYTQKDI